MEKYRTAKKGRHVGFVDLKKPYDTAPIQTLGM